MPVAGQPPFGPQGLWMPSFGQFLQESAEAKIRDWLKTIPIGNGAERGWDDAQILDIAGFAQDHKLDSLKAEDIYKRYVEFQVEKAEREAEEVDPGRLGERDDEEEDER